MTEIAGSIGPIGPIVESVSDAVEESVELGWADSFARVSGVLLAILLPVHFIGWFLTHDTADLSALFMDQRLDSPGWLLLEFAVITLAISHGLLGTHRALMRRAGDSGVAIGLFGLFATLVVLLYARTLYTLALFGS